MRRTDRKTATVALGASSPAGIVILDRFPAPAAPQLRAFVWCRHRPDRPALPTAALKAPLPGALLVGQIWTRRINGCAAQGEADGSAEDG